MSLDILEKLCFSGWVSAPHLLYSHCNIVPAVHLLYRAVHLLSRHCAAFIYPERSRGRSSHLKQQRKNSGPDIDHVQYQIQLLFKDQSYFTYLAMVSMRHFVRAPALTAGERHTKSAGNTSTIPPTWQNNLKHLK